MKRISFLLASALVPLLSAPYLALAQGAFLPSQEDIERAQQKTREAMMKAQQAGSGRQVVAPAAPNVAALPKPSAPAPDLASIAQKYKDVGKALTQGGPEDAKTDLMVFVSFSMPKEALERIVDQAEKSGATLVFRGLKGDSMMRMTEEVGRLIGNRNVNVAIHPPAFQQFSVTRVPAVVLARGEASRVMENGCARADTFVKVSGDVSLEYALDYIERKSPAWSASAREFRSKIVRGL